MTGSSCIYLEIQNNTQLAKVLGMNMLLKSFPGHMLSLYCWEEGKAVRKFVRKTRE